ncbi:DUF4181 domain-containing protein [Oceanobacillus damuensis]|uniref:DUF4181 domain-containing protein n=1 Tax=Oceanobacillus damuensis TaxID=937928 RepID=UPI0008362F47|nr:DUF4181 domain-containing protein [Oceanobacillus damuensis]
MFDFENNLIWNLTLLLGIFILLMFLFNSVMRKILNVERKKMFSNNYVNDKHKKYDIGIRSISAIVAIIALYFFTYKSSVPHMDSALYIFIIMLIFTILQELIRSYMEWKYLKDNNDYIFTLSQMIFITAAMIVFVTSDFLGLFN